MDVGEKLEQLKNLSIADVSLKQRLLDTKTSETPLSDFCRIAREAGVELYEMDVVAFGEDSYAAMRRSTNGGGENAPLLKWENDAYEMFMAELEMI
ncbi:hypothetical protein SAMN06297422_10469 [Lachnospiraceae bacterium]|nr:hypothetical protein SAMN06297422_10469 [Lachnospiraceae bacterium]